MLYMVTSQIVFEDIPKQCLHCGIFPLMFNYIYSIDNSLPNNFWFYNIYVNRVADGIYFHYYFNGRLVVYEDMLIIPDFN